MERHPKHVHIIGMISIEMANLEERLAGLLAKALGVPKIVAHAIFFTPRAGMLSVEILRESANAKLAHLEKLKSRKPKREKILKLISSIAKRSISVIGRRNELIHDTWGTIGKNVAKQKKGLWKEETPKLIDLQELSDLLRDIRNLINDTYHLHK
jgi:hypothetical protein